MDGNMISWWVALKLYVSQTALEGTHKSSHPESRSLYPHFGRHLNYAPARFCQFGGSPIGLIGIVPPTILSPSEGEWWCPSHFTLWISLEAVPKDFYGIPDYLGKYTSSFLFNRIQSVPKSVQAWTNTRVQYHGIARNLNVRIHKPQISAFMLFSNLPKCQ